MEEFNRGTYTYADELDLDDDQKVNGKYVVSVRLSPRSGIIIYGDIDSTGGPPHVVINGNVDDLELPFTTPRLRIGYQE